MREGEEVGKAIGIGAGTGIDLNNMSIKAVIM
jgi:hypothetical protein